jgi:DNA-binding response OmpR family regulator
LEQKVLVVDDSREMNLFLARLLQSEGFLVSTVSDPREAMAVFEAFQPDLVLLDLNMPYLSGWEICRKMKARRPVPVIIFSVRDAESDIARGFEAGADDYLIKPFELPDLLQRIGRFLGKPEERP